MKPFDLEAAKRGEPVEFLESGEYLKVGRYVPVHYVGVSTHGLHVIQELPSGAITYCTSESLRMAPKKVTVRYRVGLFSGKYQEQKPYTLNASDEHAEDRFSQKENFVRWLTEWQTAEIQGDE